MKKTITLFALGACIFIPNLAFAYQTAASSNVGIAGLTNGLVDQIGSVARIISAVSYVAALGFIFAGVVKFKAHKDQPAQVPLSAPITLIIVGAALAYTPGLLKVGGDTLGFKNDSSSFTLAGLDH